MMEINIWRKRYEVSVSYTHLMGSADWMPRNLDRRVEILFPVLEEPLKERIRQYMELELEDNLKAHVLQPDGTYCLLYTS